MEKENKKDFMDEVIDAFVDVFNKYKITWRNKAEEKEFKEELLMVMMDLIKGSFKNGLRIGRIRAEHGGDYKKGGAH
jgi:hypothetical protein